MADSLETEPELLWPLLLVQIVYDELTRKPTDPDFQAIASTYSKHPLLPHSAPELSKSKEAQQVYEELLNENKIDRSLAPIVQAQVLAEPLYARFHANLVAKMKENAASFEDVYRKFEQAREIPRDERLSDESQKE